MFVSLSNFMYTLPHKYTIIYVITPLLPQKSHGYWKKTVISEFACLVLSRFLYDGPQRWGIPVGYNIV